MIVGVGFKLERDSQRESRHVVNPWRPQSEQAPLNLSASAADREAAEVSPSVGRRGKHKIPLR
jgi:hypothetical protein